MNVKKSASEGGPRDCSGRWYGKLNGIYLAKHGGTKVWACEASCEGDVFIENESQSYVVSQNPGSGERFNAAIIWVFACCHFERGFIFFFSFFLFLLCVSRDEAVL